MRSQNAAADQARADVKAEVRHTVEDAMQAARDAQLAAREAQTQAREAQARAGTLVPPPFPPGFGNNDIPPQVENISIAFFVCCAVMVVGWPLARAFGRRIEGRGNSAPSIASPQLNDQLQRIEQAVDAMAIEVERISESQRFMAKLQNQSAERVLK